MDNMPHAPTSSHRIKKGIDWVIYAPFSYSLITSYSMSKTAHGTKSNKDIEAFKSQISSIDYDKVKVPLSRMQFIAIYLNLASAVFLMAIDVYFPNPNHFQFSIVSTAIPAIAQEFQNLSEISWVGTGFFITMTAFTPIFGSLCDVLGRKPAFLVAIGLFEIGSFICGIATTMKVLIIGRLVAGIGGIRS